MTTNAVTIFLVLAMLLGFVSMSKAQQVQVADQGNLSLNNLLAAKDFGGEWRLDRSQSDDVMKKLREKMASSKQKSSAAENNQLKSNELPSLSVSLFPPETLTVAAGAENEITINEGYQSIVMTRTFLADGKPQSYEMRPGVNYSVATNRSGNKLVIATVSPRGNKMVETYELSPNAKRLKVSVRIEENSGKEIFTLLRFYDRTAMDVYSVDGSGDFQ